MHMKAADAAVGRGEIHARPGAGGVIAGKGGDLRRNKIGRSGDEQIHRRRERRAVEIIREDGANEALCAEVVCAEVDIHDPRAIRGVFAQHLRSRTGVGAGHIHRVADAGVEFAFVTEHPHGLGAAHEDIVRVVGARRVVLAMHEPARGGRARGGNGPHGDGNGPLAGRARAVRHGDGDGIDIRIGKRLRGILRGARGAISKAPCVAVATESIR